MKIFKDSALKEEAQTFDLGVVSAGQSKTYTYYILNETNASLLNIKLGINHPEIKVTKFPTNMKAHESAVLEFIWSPSVTLKEGLNTKLSIDLDEIWG